MKIETITRIIGSCAILACSSTILTYGETMDTPATQGASPVAVSTIADAELSYKAACEALDKKHLDEARVHFLSAINKNPAQVKYYDALYNAAKQNPGLIDLDELLTIVRVGTFQVNHANTLKMHQMAGELEKGTQLAVSNTSVPAAGQLIQQLQSDFAIEKMVEKGTTNQLPMCAKRLELLDMIEATDQNQINIDEERRRTAAAASYIEIRDSLKVIKQNVTALLEAKSSEDMPLLNAMLQAASGLIAQSAAVDYSLLPAACRKGMAEDAQFVQEKELAYNKLLSEPVLEKIRSLNPDDVQITPKNGEQYGAFTKKILARQKIVEEITKLLPELRDTASVQQAQEVVAAFSAEISDLVEKRYMAYQDYVINKILKKVFDDYEDDGWVTDDNAIEYLKRMEYIKITHLTPETLALYQDVLSKLLDQLPASKKVKSEKDIATCPNKHDLINE